jgi:hypothetical protein
MRIECTRHRSRVVVIVRPLLPRWTRRCIDRSGSPNVDARLTRPMRTIDDARRGATQRMAHARKGTLTREQRARGCADEQGSSATSQVRSQRCLVAWERRMHVNRTCTNCKGRGRAHQRTHDQDGTAYEWRQNISMHTFIDMVEALGLSWTAEFKFGRCHFANLFDLDAPLRRTIAAWNSNMRTR